MYNIVFSVLALKETARVNITSFRIFPDPEMTQFWSVNYVCQVCKSKFLEILETSVF